MKKTVEAATEYINKKVTVIMMNGYQMKCTLVDVYMDGGVRVIDIDNHENTIWPQAISTIRPES